MRTKRLLAGLSTALLLVVLDQITKIWISNSLAYHESIPILGNIIRLTYTRNAGIAFGISMGPLTGWPLIAITVVGSILIATMLIAESKWSMWRSIAMGMVLGGAVGNLVDRLIRVEVIDFLDIGINERLRWPVFNVADAVVVVGLILLLSADRFGRHDSSRDREPQSVSAA